MQRPGRSMLTGLGTALGVAAFVAVVGITSTASGQISARFTTKSASEVTARTAGTATFSDEGLKRTAGLQGVDASGVRWDLGEMPVVVRSGSDAVQSPVSVRIFGVTDGYWTITNARVAEGHLFRGGLSSQRVALVGRALAEDIDLPPVLASPTIYLGDQPFTVIGIVEDSDRDSSPVSSVMIPRAVARELWAGTLGQEVLYLQTKVGSAGAIADQVPLALDPYNSDSTQVDSVPAASKVRSGVSEDLEGLFLSLTAVSLTIGAVGIANISLLGVMERIAEIGLRRAMGALRRHVLMQILWESAIVGAFGGVVGGLIGVSTVLAVALTQDWTPILDPRIPIIAPFLGAVVGLIAGSYPAVRASRFEPVEALRG